MLAIVCCTRRTVMLAIMWGWHACHYVGLARLPLCGAGTLAIMWGWHACHYVGLARLPLCVTYLRDWHICHYVLHKD